MDGAEERDAEEGATERSDHHTYAHTNTERQMQTHKHQQSGMHSFAPVCVALPMHLVYSHIRLTARVCSLCSFN